MNGESVSEAVGNLHGHGVETRRNSVQYLANQNPAEVLPILRQLLLTDDMEYQLSVVEAMLIVDCSTTLAEVLFLLRSSEAWVRQYMCGLLHDYGNALALDELVRLAQCDPDADVRATACYALGGIGDAKSIEPLRVVAFEDQSVDYQGEPVRNHAVAALATLAARFAGITESEAGCR